MEIFAANIAERFSIKGISKITGKDYSLVHRSIKPLIAENLLAKDKQGYLSLNYKENMAQIACVEALRTQKFFQSRRQLGVLGKVRLKFAYKLSYLMHLVWTRMGALKRRHKLAEG